MINFYPDLLTCVSTEEIISAIENVYQQGIRRIVTTSSVHLLTKEEVETKVEQINKQLTDKNIPVDVLVGHSIKFYECVVEEYEKGAILSLNNQRYILLDLPYDEIPTELEAVIYELRLKGIRPILMHPERNEEMRARPTRLHRLAEKGVYIQLEAESISGKHGPHVQKFAKQMIDHYLAHIIASHSIKSSTNLLDVYKQISKWYGEEKVLLFQKNIERIVRGESILYEEPKSIGKKKIWNLFR
jgi:protein-tyrosine phosphatase